MENTTIKLDKIGSVLKNIELPNEVNFSSYIRAKDGVAIVVKVLGEQKKYGDLELTDGRLSKIHEGDFIAGVLGERKALEGIVGIVPTNIKIGETLSILNLGGVIGKALSWNKDYVTSPLPVKVIGSIINGDKIVNIHDFAPKFTSILHKSAPIIAIIGTAMGVGKTTVATEVVHYLAKHKGLKVAAAKLTGVAAQRDILAMHDAGAVKALTFHDLGFTSTIQDHGIVIPAAKTIVNQLNSVKPDCIVIEMGDGLLGWYGVGTLLSDKDFVKAIVFTILCCHDVVGAYGAIELLKKSHISVDYVAGPVSNNTAGTDYLEKFFNIPSQDLREDKTKFFETLQKKGVFAHD